MIMSYIGTEEYNRKLSIWRYKLLCYTHTYIISSSKLAAFQMLKILIIYLHPKWKGKENARKSTNHINTLRITLMWEKKFNKKHPFYIRSSIHLFLMLFLVMMMMMCLDVRVSKFLFNVFSYIVCCFHIRLSFQEIN